MNQRRQNANQSYTWESYKSTPTGSQNYTKESYKTSGPVQRSAPSARGYDNVQVRHSVKETMKTKVTVTAKQYTEVREHTVRETVSAKISGPKAGTSKAIGGRSASSRMYR
ncbi:uncharacterized protein LOC118197877 [Stegodyphus dumicola]|uniref:uncharacterized protein LOC118197877 n=1 Tax=Stegodyphus dumicola TaxID=202533 RepID=UPI0015AF984F|nr:uncharacterized protein LOC118197877 [Stegodyphus dumicola]